MHALPSRTGTLGTLKMLKLARLGRIVRLLKFKIFQETLKCGANHAKSFEILVELFGEKHTSMQQRLRIYYDLFEKHVKAKMHDIFLWAQLVVWAGAETYDPRGRKLNGPCLGVYTVVSLFSFQMNSTFLPYLPIWHLNTLCWSFVALPFS